MKYNKQYSNFTRQCKATRALHGLTEEDVATLVGVGKALIYKYERQLYNEAGPKMRKVDEFYKTLRAMEEMYK